MCQPFETIQNLTHKTQCSFYGAKQMPANNWQYPAVPSRSFRFNGRLFRCAEFKCFFFFFKFIFRRWPKEWWAEGGEGVKWPKLSDTFSQLADSIGLSCRIRATGCAAASRWPRWIGSMALILFIRCRIVSLVMQWIPNKLPSVHIFSCRSGCRVDIF